MLQYAIVFFVIAITAALFGFSGIAAGAAGIAKVLFFVCLIGGIVTLVMGSFGEIDLRAESIRCHR